MKRNLKQIVDTDNNSHHWTNATIVCFTQKYDLGILNRILCKIPYLKFVKSEEPN